MNTLLSFLHGIAASSPLWFLSVFGQDLKEWETAINYMQDGKGCLSIPFSSYRSDCERKQDEVNKACKQSGPMSCTDIDPKNYQKHAEDLKLHHQNLVERLRQLKSVHPDEQHKREWEEKIRHTEDEIKAVENQQYSLKQQVEQIKRQVNDRYLLARSCAEYRRSVNDIFARAKGDAEREHNAQKEPLAKRLVAWWTTQEPGHDDAVRNANTAREGCERVMADMDRVPTTF